MWVSQLRIVNFKSYADSGEIHFARGFNILIGPNNAGKSTVLKSLYRLQAPSAVTELGLRRGTDEVHFRLVFSGIVASDPLDVLPQMIESDPKLVVTCDFVCPRNQIPGAYSAAQPNGTLGFGSLPDTEPRNFIYPYLAKRKVLAFDQSVNQGAAMAVADNLVHLVAKIDELREPRHPAHTEFTEACISVLGFPVSTFPSPGGKQAGLVIAHRQYIPLEEMGEGTAHLVGLICRLCIAEDKLFLIEEIENDIHPKALKGLLRLMAAKADKNQFILSTHSNIVTKFLGSEPASKLFSVQLHFERGFPTSSIAEIGNDPEERRSVLEDLGYELSDFDLWQGWLILEESSAERFIREWLIPWFVPELSGRIRTIAATGTSTVEPKFEDFSRLFLFTHLESIYHNRAWVILDGDPAGTAVIESLRQKYSGWDGNCFTNFEAHDFERCYPPRFRTGVERALKTRDKKKQREAKKAILDEVIEWIRKDEFGAKKEFEDSASDVIGQLRIIAESLDGLSQPQGAADE